jgi:hypothetical protein
MIRNIRPLQNALPAPVLETLASMSASAKKTAFSLLLAELGFVFAQQKGTAK